MTYIEFFDKTLIENICTSLTNPPERVILIGNKLSILEKHARRYAQILRKRGYEVEFICRLVNKNSMSEVIKALSQIVETYDNCTFDLTGGDDVFIAATGIISERYKDKNIQMHKFNIYNNTVQDCDLDGRLIYKGELPGITVEENIRIYGGEILNDTGRWDFSAEFAEDVCRMWDICRKNPNGWNVQSGVLAICDKIGRTTDGSVTVVNKKELQASLRNATFKDIFKWRIIDELTDAGFLFVTNSDKTISIKYKNSQVKKSLLKSGQILELKVYLSVLNASASGGVKEYNDAAIGVSIDWDGHIHKGDGKFDIENEIDVMMMHGMVPVFVSCKNGAFDADELYKLNTVAQRFGEKYSKKVLIATSLERSRTTEFLKERAADMEIRIIDNFQNLNDVEIQKLVRTLWRS